MKGFEILRFAKEIFPINRSLTGSGVRETLSRIQAHLPDLRVIDVPSGTPAFDWTVPDEWEIAEAFVEDPEGNRIVDFKNHNLHVVGYSVPVDSTMTLEELDEHLHSIPDKPEAIPYVTSYYKDQWGFCLPHSQRVALQPGTYRACIKSRKFKGVMNYGELVIPGQTAEEILLTTYVCHPSMANNEVSGPAVLTFLGKWLKSRSNRYTYRLVFAPETIGAIYYLSVHMNHLKQHVRAGFNISCVGDERNYSFVASRKGDSLADRIAIHALRAQSTDFVRHSFLERQSDERQYGGALVDLPFVSVCRTKYGCYDEYHTSLDDFTVVTAKGLEGGFEVLSRCIEIVEENRVLVATQPCEPHLGKRNLYPSLGGGRVPASVDALLNVHAYCDGQEDLLAIAESCNLSFGEAASAARVLEQHGLVREVPHVRFNV